MKKTRVISARLHPNDDIERQALDYLDAMSDAGFSARQTIADALYKMAHNGNVPTYYHQQQALTPDIMQSMLRDFARHILDNMPKIQATSGTNFNAPTEENDADGYLDNLINSFQRRKDSK